jgi:hypothetical protein
MNNSLQILIVSVILTFWFIVLPLIPGFLAKIKNRSFLCWFLFSSVISIVPSIIPGFILGILMVYILPRPEEKPKFIEKNKNGKNLLIFLFYSIILAVICAIVLIFAIKFGKSLPWLSSFIPGVKHVAPVLQSNVLNYHIITFNSAFYLFVITLILQTIVLMKKQFSQNFDFYFLLTVIILWVFALISGSIWANQSLGRYWAWDPKETWSFLTLGGLTQAIILNIIGRIMEKTKKGCIVTLCFNSVIFLFLIFTKFGVNLLLASLYPY